MRSHEICQRPAASLLRSPRLRGRGRVGVFAETFHEGDAATTFRGRWQSWDKRPVRRNGLLGGLAGWLGNFPGINLGGWDFNGFFEQNKGDRMGDF